MLYPTLRLFPGQSSVKRAPYGPGAHMTTKFRVHRVMFITNFILRPSLQNRGSSFFRCLMQGSGLLPRDGSQVCHIDGKRGDPRNQSRDCLQVQTRSKHSLSSEAIYLPHSPDEVFRLLIAANVENSHTFVLLF